MYFESVTIVDRAPLEVVSVMLVIGDRLVDTFGVTVAVVVVVRAPLPAGFTPAPLLLPPINKLLPSVVTQLFTDT